MRVTSMLADSQYQMQLRQQALAEASQQLSTGKRVNELSDDPAAAANNIRSLTESANVDQFTSNATTLNAQMQTADSAISQIVTTLTTAITIGTSAANGTNAAQRGINAQQIESLLTSVVALGNTTYQGQYMFAGSSTGSAPFLQAYSSFTSSQGSAGTPLTTSTALTAGSITQISDATTGTNFTFTAHAGDTIATLQAAIAGAVSAGTLSSGVSATINASGKLQIDSGSTSSGIYVSSNDAALGSMGAVSGTNVADAYAYVGSSTVNTVQIGSSMRVDSNLPGDQLLTTGTNVIGAMNSLITALKTGGTTQIGDAVSAVTTALNKVNQVRVPLDNTMNQISTQENYLNQEKVSLTSAQNSLVGIDAAEAATNLSQAQTAYQTVLAAAAKVLPQSLLDYLK